MRYFVGVDAIFWGKKVRLPSLIKSFQFCKKKWYRQGRTRGE